MTKRIFGSCVLMLSVAALCASAQEAREIKGVWLSTVTPVDCQSGAIIGNAVPFRGTYLFHQDGSMTNEAGFLVSSPSRSSGFGTWHFSHGKTYTSKFHFFRYNPDGSLLAMREVTLTLVFDGDLFTSTDKFQDFDADNKPLPASGCNIESGMRLQ